MTYDEMVNWENRQWNRYSKELEEEGEEKAELDNDHDCDPDDIDNPEKNPWIFLRKY